MTPTMQKIKLQIMGRSKRGPGKIKIGLGIREGYKHYKEAVKDAPEQFQIDSATYRKIMKEAHLHIVDQIINDIEEVRFPAGMPSFRVKKYKRKIRVKDGQIVKNGLAVNWKATRELWDSDEKAKEAKKLIYFLNDHTDGYSAMVWMNRVTHSIPKFTPYQFRPTRDVNRQLAEVLLDPFNRKDYYA